MGCLKRLRAFAAIAPSDLVAKNRACEVQKRLQHYRNEHTYRCHGHRRALAIADCMIGEGVLELKRCDVIVALKPMFRDLNHSPRIRSTLHITARQTGGNRAYLTGDLRVIMFRLPCLRTSTFREICRMMSTELESSTYTPITTARRVSPKFRIAPGGGTSNYYFLWSIPWSRNCKKPQHRNHPTPI